MSDLSANSELWWKRTLEELQIWYEDHMKLAPLARSSHSMETPAALQDRKWARLERRVASMLFKAIPPGAREEMISGKKTTVFAILATLQVAYQPGGLAEKEIILRNLEQPNEATSIQEAVLSPRKWGRWRTRAQELGVAEPDPSILMRGLTRLTKRVVDNSRELLFRISLARSTLMVDCAPTRSSVSQFANHLQAELEQIAHVERRGAAAANNNKQEVKVKKLEERTEAKGEGKGKGKREEKGGERMPCKFFLTEEGCKERKTVHMAACVGWSKTLLALWIDTALSIWMSSSGFESWEAESSESRSTSRKGGEGLQKGLRQLPSLQML